MKKYNILNNSIGWLVFAIAAITYLLTIEPTASFWDCGEFIAQGYKLEVGHPPGNPIFMLAARFFINFAPSPSTVAMAVNSMSALLSAATILLLFWSITHLTRKIVTKEGEENFSLSQMLIIFGSGVVGALAYTWSDTFWFSAVEGEVYAFSSFCTALVFWLILKWENRADKPSSDRYLILIAYVIGVSIAVHLLNLLCIPAIVLVFYYRKWKSTNVKGSMIALLVSFAIIVFILYGLVPGFVKVAQWFELFFVNELGFSFNSGVIFYAILDLALFIWSISELYRQTSPTRIKISFLLSLICSGMLFIGNGWIIPVLLTIALIVYLFKFCPRIPVRIFNLIIMSVLVIFIGYSSYALILIRSNAQTPMDQNSPDNVFALASYLNREQYGQRPLIYGKTFSAQPIYKQGSNGSIEIVKTNGRDNYAKEVKTNPNQPDRYKMTGTNYDYKTNPELDMLFPRLYSDDYTTQYISWLGLSQDDLSKRMITISPVYDENNQPVFSIDGNNSLAQQVVKPTVLDNLSYFINYQLNYMYWRYFMWNFAGRQNDLQGNGEITHGNWISGIPVIDNARLGDQSLMPADLTTGNKGHNVFYLLPLLLGIFGLLWQAYSGKKGIEQFWVIFFLFFMTGIAIVIYLNQTPSQPRERDYAFAGSFYAFAIWIGMGVAGVWKALAYLLRKKAKDGENAEQAEIDNKKLNTTCAVVACVLGILVPIQMVSQTWDDHDRSGRYACRDFGMNYLSSVGPNGIIFTNGDNDTFPLWYAQEVEGYRNDVRVVNLSYLTTDWYIDQMRRQAYESAPLPMLAKPLTFAYGNRQASRFDNPVQTPVPALESLNDLYFGKKADGSGVQNMDYPIMYIPVNKQSVVKNNIVDPSKYEIIDKIDIDMLNDRDNSAIGGIYSNKLMTIDILASNAASGWKRPIYFAMTVPDNYYLGLGNYMKNTGLAYEVTPTLNPDNNYGYGVNTDKMYYNVMNKFRWGGFDKATPNKTLYVDETVSRMITTHRSSLIDLASALINEGRYSQQIVKNQAINLNTLNASEKAKLLNYPKDRFDKARNVLVTMDKKLPTFNAPYAPQIGMMIANAYIELGEASGNKADTAKGLSILKNEIMRYAQYVRFYQSLNQSQYSLLSQEDERIDQTLFGAMIQLYNQYTNDAQTKVLLDALHNKGINMDRVYKMVQAANQQQQEQYSGEQSPGY